MSEMTDEQIQAIEDRARAATPGPWHNEDAPWKVHPSCCASRVCTIGDDHPHDDAGAPVDDDAIARQRAANGAFIAAARTDIPLLCAALREARNERDRLQADANALAGGVFDGDMAASALRVLRDSAIAERDEARAEVARLCTDTHGPKRHAREARKEKPCLVCGRPTGGCCTVKT